MTLDADVVISGGGLAGAATAIALLRTGARVLMIERASFPRDKPCGEGLLPHGIEQLAALGADDLLPRCDAQPFRGILYRCGDVVAPGDFEDGQLGRGVRRLALDAALQARAVEAGATLVKDAVLRAAVDAEGATLTLEKTGTLRARVVVGADGPRSVVRHTLGLDLGPSRKPRYAMRQHFALAAAQALPDRVEVDTHGGFELYVTPVGPRTVGLAALCEKSTMDRGSGKPAERLQQLIARSPRVSGLLAGAAAVSDALACGPLRVRARSVWSGRAVLVGDAAGYVDALTGEGMSLALKTARMCAAATHRVLDGEASDAAFDRYRAERAAVFRDHALLTFALIAIARRPKLARRTIARLARDPALFTRLLAVNNGTRTLFELSLADYVKLALGTSPRALARLTQTAAG